MTPEPWRLRCPDGHAALQIRSAWYYCQACEAHYEGEPYDPKFTDLPVNEEPLTVAERVALGGRDRGGSGRERAQVSPFGAIIACGLMYLLVLAVVLLGVVL